GKARVQVERERDELRVEAEGLQPGVGYQVVVDGVNLGIVTPGSKYLKVEFTSDGSSGRVLPASLRPAYYIKHVELQELSGRVILQGDFQPGGGDIGGGDDGGGDDGGGGGQDFYKEARFSRTGVDSNAEGRVRVRMSDSREELRIEAEELDRSTQFVIVVDGISIGTFRSDSDGELDLEFSTEAGKLPLPPQVRPVINIRRVEIRTMSGQAVLIADLPS
ncbi:MAG TPA: hypothetical protein VLD57_01070, partial [Blastocatellia bacterium]|nr:hypothetical protein [Blastocatellia bacterium]